MLLKKHYHEKEMKCPGCKNVVKPIIIKNKLDSAGLFGFGKAGLGLPKRKFFLICPKCGYIMSSK